MPCLCCTWGHIWAPIYLAILHCMYLAYWTIFLESFKAITKQNKAPSSLQHCLPAIYVGKKERKSYDRCQMNRFVWLPNLSNLSNLVAIFQRSKLLGQPFMKVTKISNMPPGLRNCLALSYGFGSHLHDCSLMQWVGESHLSIFVQ